MSTKELYTSPEYEEAPRLSFCDLLESAHCDANSSKNNNCNSRCSNEEDDGLVFEFFSSRSDFSFTAPENIIFCGKQMTTPERSSKKKNNLKKKVLSWMTPSSSSSSSPSKQRNKCSKKKRSWWMVMFGSVRVPKEMDLSDIKTRQNRRPPEAVKAFVAMFDDHQKQTNKLAMEIETKTSSSINGLIEIVKSFSCKV